MKGDPQLFDDEPYRSAHPEPGGQGKLFDTAPYEQPQSSGVSDKVHPGQFQMFMTPREIRTKYQALDADRQYADSDRGGEMTARPETTGGMPNDTLSSARRRRYAGWHGGTDQVAQYTHTRTYESHEESDDELFDRKLEESQMSPRDYRDVHGGDTSPPEPPGWSTLAKNSTAPSQVRRWGNDEWTKPPGVGSWTQGEAEHEANVYREVKHEQHYENWEEEHDYGPSLHDRISAEGVQSPVHLSYDQLGSVGKPQIVGGHHRVAAAHDIDPDFPIPVQHWKNMREARGSGKYD